jgi:hypothetical protein
MADATQMTASMHKPVASMLRSASSQRHGHSLLNRLLADLSEVTVTSRSGRRCCRFLTELFYPNEIDELTELFQQVLGESPAHAKAISADQLLYRHISRRCWQRMANSSFSRVRKSALDCLFPHKHQVVRYIRSCQRGVLITTIHMGDYLHGLLHLCLSASSRRKVFILRNRRWDQQEERAFQKFAAAGSRVTVLRRQRNVALQAVIQLRRGNVVIALYDLNRHWGSTTRVTFFGHEVALVKGPAKLAILAQADILPIMFHYASDGSRAVDSFPAIRPCRHGSDSVEAAATRVTQHLADRAEQQIRQFPSQWHHWHLFPDMLADD